MKWKVPMLMVLAVLGLAVALAVVGCSEQQEEVTGEMIEQLPEAAEEVFTGAPEEPGLEETPGLEVEEMVDDTPPHVPEEAEVEDAEPAPAPEADN
ncbi:MAG: hypothetical protein ACOX9R_16705 [Armatimonadota bacterium]|jgi:outer membrane biosynthesis protein TonB